MSSTLDLPRHIGYIVDGNRRWAQAHGLPKYEGHLAGYNTLKDVALATLEAGVEYMSAYVFSTENWKRDKDEVSKLLGLVLKLVTSDLPDFDKHQIRLVVMGDRSDLPSRILDAITKAESETAKNTRGTLALCFNYGGQREIVDAIKKVVQSGVDPNEIDEALVEQYLYQPEVPACDLIVRTSGEQRLSNFQLWRSAYSELLFIDKNWPDMTADDVTAILDEYKSRKRRFGG